MMSDKNTDTRPEEIKKILRDMGYKQPRKNDWVVVDEPSTKKIHTPRKLKATWTPKLANDLKAYHGIDAESELTKVLSEQIQNEIDDKIFKIWTKA